MSAKQLNSCVFVLLQKKKNCDILCWWSHYNLLRLRTESEHYNIRSRNGVLKYYLCQISNKPVYVEVLYGTSWTPLLSPKKRWQWNPRKKKLYIIVKPIYYYGYFPFPGNVCHLFFIIYGLKNIISMKKKLNPFAKMFFNSTIIVIFKLILYFHLSSLRRPES